MGYIYQFKISWEKLGNRKGLQELTPPEFRAVSACPPSFARSSSVSRDPEQGSEAFPSLLSFPGFSSWISLPARAKRDKKSFEADELLCLNTAIF